ncbi:hypothetical protein [Streptomyces venezuelae]|uniref:hypothetical protein n=1 Tax=Streptomyces venezuelae TaxID=54571 RepID=UPI00341850DD
MTHLTPTQDAVREALYSARAAATRAGMLAADAERLARHPDHHQKAAPLAAAGTLWADVARAHAARAQATQAALEHVGLEADGTADTDDETGVR